MMGLEQATILTAHSCRCMAGGGQSPRIYHLLHSCSSVKISEQGCRQTIRVDAPNAYDHRAKRQVSVKRDHPWEKGDKYIWEERSSGTMCRAVPSPASYYTQREPSSTHNTGRCRQPDTFLVLVNHLLILVQILCPTESWAKRSESPQFKSQEVDPNTKVLGEPRPAVLVEE